MYTLLKSIVNIYIHIFLFEGLVCYTCIYYTFVKTPLIIKPKLSLKVSSEVLVTQSYPTLYDPMYCSLQGSSVHGIFQARILKCVAISFSILTTGSKQMCILSHDILCDPMDCSLQGSSVHGIFQARILEWVVIPFSRTIGEVSFWIFFIPVYISESCLNYCF